MSDDEKKQIAKLKGATTRRLRKLCAQHLEPLGFKKDGGQFWFRTTNTLRQNFHFSFANGAKIFCERSFAYLPDFSCWSDAPQDSKTQEALERFRSAELKSFEVGAVQSLVRADPMGWDFPPENDDVEIILNQAESFLTTNAIPFFERYQEANDVLRGYLAGVPETDIFGFGGNVFWVPFYFATTYFHNGAYAEAAASFDQAVEETLDACRRMSPDWLDPQTGWLREDDSFRVYMDAAKIGADCMRRLAESQGKAGE